MRAAGETGNVPRMMLQDFFKLSGAVQFAAEVVFCKSMHKPRIISFISFILHIKEPCAKKRQQVVNGPLKHDTGNPYGCSGLRAGSPD